MKYLARFIIVCVLLGGCGHTDKAVHPEDSSKTAQVKKVLVITGIDHPAHNWRDTAPALADVLRADGRLRVNVVENPEFLGSPEIEDYDVIVLHFMNWEKPAPGAGARANLREFVGRGRGLMIVHFGCGAFQDWPEFRDLAGRVWDPKLRAHDPKGPFRVDIVKRDHPITRGMEPFETDDELYTCIAGERPIELLATARSKVDGKDYPMAFAFDYGKGRVFHCALGHDVKAVENPGAAELFRRGCAWSAGLSAVGKAPQESAAKK